MKSNVTFVSSYLKIYDTDYDLDKTFEKRLELFIKILNLGINVCIFISPEYENTFIEITNKYDNIKIIQVLSISDLEVSKIIVNHNFQYELPERRSHIKDLPNYIILMNSKVEFLYKSIILNPFNSEYFCWFDFSLPYIFKDIDKTLIDFKKYAFRNYIDSFIAIPGCWNHVIHDINFLKKQVVWRFCGGFFIGDKQSLLNFYDSSIKYFFDFLQTTNTLLWEVNYWAWLERENHIQPIWYEADHNDTIINIPHNLYTICYKKYANEIIFYPLWDSNIYLRDNNSIIQDKFYPSSTSYIYDYKNNKHIINTRHVNYYYKDNWDCDFFSSNHTRQVININVKSELNNENMNTTEPFKDVIMNYDDDNFKSISYSYSIGLEDIRLFYDNCNNIKFIASNVNYISENTNGTKIIIGDYDFENGICKNMKIINTMWESNCEKNWSPIISNICISSKQLFIYKWSPFIVGFINDDDYFETIIERKYEDKILNLFRGSTCFVNYINDVNKLVGVVHYSVRGKPPIYYHSLVLLDKNTNLPLFYSDPFKFTEKPIEFCIGFTIIEKEYLFWISQMDREPFLIKIDVDKILIFNKVI